MRNRENFYLILVIFAAVFVAYGSALSAGFVWDDDFLVVQNPLLRAPLWSFQMFKEDIVNSGFDLTIYYRPVQILSYAIDYRFWGLRPFGFHLVSILLHFMNSILVLLLAWKLTSRKEVSFLGAVLFAVSPLAAGVVSYVSGRADLLMFFFAFLSILSFVLFREGRGRAFLLATPAFFVLSLLSKEAAVALPFVILLVDIFMAEKPAKPGIIAHALNFSILALYALVHFYFFGSRYHAVFSLDGLSQSALLFLKMAGEFFVLIIAPFGARMRHAAGGAPASAAIIAATLAGILLLSAGKKRRPLLLAAGFYLVALLPLLFVVRYFSVFAEHWVYMPSFGVFLFVSLLVAGLALSGARIYRALSMVLIFSSMFLYVSATLAENSSWISTGALSDRLLAFSGSDQAAIHFKALSLLGEKGSGEKIGELMRAYTALGPGDPRTWYIKGRMELASGNAEKAVSDFNEALRLDPSYDRGYLGLAFSALAEDNVSDGIKYLEKAAALNPRNTEALVFLATAYSKAGNEAKALLAAENAKKTNPYDYNVIVNLGTAYARRGDVREAARQFLEASRLYPEKAMPCYNLARIFQENGQKDTALSYVREALEREPDFKPALELLHAIRAGNADPDKPVLEQ